MAAPSTRELAFAAAGLLAGAACLTLAGPHPAAVSSTEEEPDAAAESPVQIRTRESETMLIPVDRLKKFVADVFIHCGCLPEEATLAGEVLVLADHRGIDSHGVARLHAYFTLLEAGEINPRPNVRKTISTATTATVDGDNGLGLIVGPKANAIAMDMAEKHGSGWVAICIKIDEFCTKIDEFCINIDVFCISPDELNATVKVSVKNTNHYGIAGFYSLQAIEREMVLIQHLDLIDFC